VTGFIGTILLRHILHAAQASADIPLQERKQFSLYLDGYQHYASDEIANFLAKIRQHNIATCITHQFRYQLDPLNRAVTFNMGNKVIFHVSDEDAQELAKLFFLPLRRENIEDEPPYEKHVSSRDEHVRIANELSNLTMFTARVKIGQHESTIQTISLNE